MMNRVKDVSDLMFDVRLVPVYAGLGELDSGSLQRVPGKRAVVNCSDGRVLSVVSRDYQLVSNAAALEHALLCCRMVFPELKANEWHVDAAYAPRSCGHCQIDLAHKSKGLSFASVKAGDRPEVFGPYIRVTNSYNRTRALKFDIGFMRKVCSNGLIMEQASVRFSLNHNTRNLRRRIEAELSHSRFQGLAKNFLELMRPLRECHIPRFHFLPITVGTLRIKEPKTAGRPGYEDWYRLRAEIDSLSDKYAGELDETAYALLNVITDIASRPSEVGLMRRERHSLQRMAGAWLAEFSKECRSSDFDAANYVGKLIAGNATARRPSTPRAILGLPRM